MKRASFMFFDNGPRSYILRRFTMSETTKHVLPNGYTFLASTANQYGTWAKATDPITAIKNAHDHDGSDKVPIYVVYGKDEEIYVSDFGGYNWKTENPPTPIGIFTVTARIIDTEDDYYKEDYPIIQPVEKGDFNKSHNDCLEWMLENISNIEKSIEINKE